MGFSVFVTAVFGLVWTTAAGMLALGFFAAFNMVTSQTLVQQETPHEMLGRVSSSLMSMMAVSQVLAMFVAGPVAEFSGLRNLYFGSAVMLAAVAGVGLLWLRKDKDKGNDKDNAAAASCGVIRAPAAASNSPFYTTI